MNIYEWKSIISDGWFLLLSRYDRRDSLRVVMKKKIIKKYDCI